MYLEKNDYKQLVLWQDDGSGLKAAIIAIHDKPLEAAIGGSRM